VGLEIRAADEDEVDELRDFFRWLRDDEDGPELVRLEQDTAGSGGAMGALEFIDVVLTQTVALGGLAAQYAAWRRSRLGRSGGAGFTFTRPSDGLSIDVRGGSEDEVRRLVAFLAEPAASAPDDGNPSVG